MYVPVLLLFWCWRFDILAIAEFLKCPEVMDRPELKPILIALQTWIQFFASSLVGFNIWIISVTDNLQTHQVSERMKNGDSSQKRRFSVGRNLVWRADSGVKIMMWVDVDDHNNLRGGGAKDRKVERVESELGECQFMIGIYRNVYRPAKILDWYLRWWSME
jgi:hypothetical protein